MFRWSPLAAFAVRTSGRNVVLHRRLFQVVSIFEGVSIGVAGQLERKPCRWSTWPTKFDSNHSQVYHPKTASRKITYTGESFQRLSRHKADKNLWKISAHQKCTSQNACVLYVCVRVCSCMYEYLCRDCLFLCDKRNIFVQDECFGIFYLPFHSLANFMLNLFGDMYQKTCWQCSAVARKR